MCCCLHSLCQPVSSLALPRFLPLPCCRRIRTSTQLCQFLAAVVPQDPPAAPGTAAAAAAAAAAQPGRPLSAPLMPVVAELPMPVVAAPLVGARKRKPQHPPSEEARSWVGTCNGTPAMALSLGCFASLS